MGDGRKRALRVQFDRRLKLEFHGAKITSDGGLLLYRELDEVLGLSSLRMKCCKLFTQARTNSTR